MTPHLLTCTNTPRRRNEGVTSKFQGNTTVGCVMLTGETRPHPVVEAALLRLTVLTQFLDLCLAFPCKLQQRFARTPVDDPGRKSTASFCRCEQVVGGLAQPVGWRGSVGHLAS